MPRNRLNRFPALPKTILFVSKILYNVLGGKKTLNFTCGTEFERDKRIVLNLFTYSKHQRSGIKEQATPRFLNQ